MSNSSGYHNGEIVFNFFHFGDIVVLRHEYTHAFDDKNDRPSNNLEEHYFGLMRQATPIEEQRAKLNTLPSEYRKNTLELLAQEERWENGCAHPLNWIMSRCELAGKPYLIDSSIRIFDESEYEARHPSAGNPYLSTKELFASGTTVLLTYPDEFQRKFQGLPDSTEEHVLGIAQKIISSYPAHFFPRLEHIDL